MKAKIFDDMNAGPFKAKVDERYHKLGQDCPDDGWVTGYLLRDLHQGEILPHIFNCPCTWIVEEETIEPVGFHIAQWIKVTDRLPEEGTPNVIVLKERHIAFLGRYDYEGFHINGKVVPNDDILCYMTLVPPKED